VFVAETSASEPPLILRDHRVASALCALPARFSRAAAEAAWAGILGADTSAAFDVLAREGVLVCADHDEWAAGGWWEAALFHEATRDFPFVAMDEPGAAGADEARMARFIDRSPPPPPALALTGLPRTPLAKLPPGDWDSRVDELPPERRRGAEGIGLLLDACCGVRRELRFGEQGTFYGKSVPSGGARHPTELVVATFAIDGIAPGVYHYSPPEHALAELSAGDTAARWRHATYDLFDRAPSPPRALVVFASLWERAMWRYRDDRSARAPLIDAGHVIGAFRTCAERLGFELRSYQKSRDREVAELCCADPRRLTPLYVAILS
jgi:SagB-type dehydrogenase family enzyme